MSNPEEIIPDFGLRDIQGRFRDSRVASLTQKSERLAGLIHFMAQCAFRKAEVALAPGDEFGPMHLERVHTWSVGRAPPGPPRTLYRFAGAHTRYDEPPAAHSRARQGTYGRVRR